MMEVVWMQKQVLERGIRVLLDLVSALQLQPVSLAGADRSQ